MNVYDFDETIYKRDSSKDFIIFLYMKKPSLVFKTAFKSFIALIKYYLLHKGDKEEMKEILFSPLLSFDNKEEIIKEFWDKNEKDIKEFYLNQRKDDDLIISASPTFLIKEICDRLNIKYMASPLNIDTMKFEGRNCYGEEKVKRFKEVYNEDIDEFYSDSLSDKYLAHISKKAYLVDKDRIIDWPKRD